MRVWTLRQLLSGGSFDRSSLLYQCRLARGPRLALLAALLALAALAALPGRPAQAAEPVVLKWTVDGTEREALVFVPAVSTQEGKIPLVFAFHGHGSSMRRAARDMALERLWPEALVVYPQGLRIPAGSVDPLGFLAGWQFSAGEKGDRDLKLVDVMIAWLKGRYPIDDRRVYAAGFSNGGFFGYYLWEARPGTFAAFASCAGRIGDRVRLSVPKPILQIAGEKDGTVPFAEQERTIATVRALDGVSDTGESCGAGCTLYPSTKNAPVEVILHAGEHVYPPWASARIVEFFKAQALSR